MASVTAAAGVLRSGYTEQKRKNAGKDITRKRTIHVARNPEKQKEIRSPLTEKSNRVPQKNTAPIKPMEQKSVNPINKENVGPNVNKNLKPLTFSQSFLRTKTIKEKQQKDEKLKSVSIAAEQKPTVKPVLGAYRGKIIQSKINSFRKPSDPAGTNTMATEREPVTQTVANKSKASATRKPLAKPSNASDMKQKRAQIPPVTSQVRASTSVVSKRNTEHLTMRRAERITSQTKSSTTTIKNKAEHVTVRRTTNFTTETKTSVGAITKRKMDHVTTRRTTNITGNKKSLGDNAQTELKKGFQSALVLRKKRITTGPVSSLSNSQEKKPAQQQPSGGKYPKANETAEERKARLAAWRVSKGRVDKRPLLSVAAPGRVKEEEEELPAIKREPEEVKEEPRQLFWATMAEEDEQEVFTLKVSHGFAECQKLIDQGIPKEEILTILEKQIQYIPEARKLSRYWECLARLEQRESQPYKVIEVCEEAVAAGAQPLEELKTILADTLEQLKTCSEESQDEAVETKAEVKSEQEVLSDTNQKKKRGRRRAMKLEHKSPSSSPEKESKPQGTPEKDKAISSVVRFSVCTTPHLERMRKQLRDGESSIKGYKFLTPVRRSSRLERKSHVFPDMLKDHDPCITGIAQLEDLEEPEGCPNAYIFRKNEALKEVTAGNLAEK
ncbi:cytoskeleton-associated protein 2 [Hyperolius riggenbachi]|uniref:cytoskeleton-associated protein 2 n=1 Tax=Hyperolius riggenbachi TaxID=752182 RepID=UPI0035A3CF9E